MNIYNEEWKDAIEQLEWLIKYSKKLGVASCDNYKNSIKAIQFAIIELKKMNLIQIKTRRLKDLKQINKRWTIRQTKNS